MYWSKLLVGVLLIYAKKLPTIYFTLNSQPPRKPLTKVSLQQLKFGLWGNKQFY